MLRALVRVLSCACDAYLAVCPCCVPLLRAVGVPPSERKREKGATPRVEGETHVSYVSCTRLLQELNKIQQESPSWPMVASGVHIVCLNTEHIERQRSLRSHEIADADTEGAVLFSLAKLYLF